MGGASPPRVPDAVQRAASAERCTADPGPRLLSEVTRNRGPGSAAHHFALRASCCAAPGTRAAAAGVSLGQFHQRAVTDHKQNRIPRGPQLSTRKLQFRQRPFRFGGRRNLHQRLTVEHDFVADFADAGQPRALALGKEIELASLLQHRLDEHLGIGPEFAHEPIVIGVFDRHRLQSVFGQPQQPRARICHEHWRMGCHDHLADS
jgi:hypothetical protein